MFFLKFSIFIVFFWSYFKWINIGYGWCILCLSIKGINIFGMIWYYDVFVICYLINLFVFINYEVGF